MTEAPDKGKRTPLVLVGKRAANTIPIGLKRSELKGVSLTPLQLLGVILKAVLKNRITDEEVDRISAVYYDTIESWWG